MRFCLEVNVTPRPPLRLNLVVRYHVRNEVFEVAQVSVRRSCHRCGRAAVWLAHGWFYCARHFPHGMGKACRPLRSAGGRCGASGAPGPFCAPPVGVDAAAARR